MQNVEIITRSNMAARSDSLPRPSWERFCQCVQSVCKVFNVSTLRERQLQALYSFVKGEDVFVNLPTGYGKSLIFQMAPLVHMWMHDNVTIGSWKKEPIILIISPLLALMQDQVRKLTSLGLKVTPYSYLARGDWVLKWHERAQLSI